MFKTIKVAEREDMTYELAQDTWSFDPSKNGKWFAYVVFQGFGSRRTDRFQIGSAKGYKTEKGAINAVKKDAAHARNWAPDGATLVF